MGKDIQFQYTDGKTPKIFHLRMNDQTFNLYEQVNGKMVKFPSSKISAPVAGTDLTYEDLSMRFLYWPNAKHEGVEKVGGQDCYKIRVDRPRGTPGAYEVVYVWVHQKYGAFMRIRGHDKAGKMIKEFQVEDVMKIDNDLWTLRKMQVATHDPKSGRRKSITEVTMDTNRRSAGPRGLR
ncbi:MAG: outer membrane lipoprotein-sorting protein, partial [Verrucomicrobiales bacterium]